MEDSSREMARVVGQMFNIPLSLSICSLELALMALRDVQKFVTATSPPTAGGSDATEDTNLIHDTFDGLAAFVVPGSDPYSSAQGVVAEEPGAVNAGVTDIFVTVIDRAVPSAAQGPSSSAAVASLLNQVAQKVSPSATGSFPSFFSRLTFIEKAAVFQFIEGDQSMLPFRRIGGILAFFVAFLFYSEASTFDFATRKLGGRPAGWVASNYAGVSDGSCEFLGYFQNRRQAQRNA